MKVYLDDERQTPEGWVRAYWPNEVIYYLESGQVTEISLDHDLGDDSRGDGYVVLKWLEEAVAINGFNPPKIRIHTSNPPARLRMTQAVHAIERLAGKEIFIP